jgi:hypothetical protein
MMRKAAVGLGEGVGLRVGEIVGLGVGLGVGFGVGLGVGGGVVTYGVKNPALHCMQTLLPDTLLKKPLWQGLHIDDAYPFSYVPGRHGVHDTAPIEALLNLPGLQLWHDATPGCGE